MKILANGEIVPDDDPRVKTTSNRSNSNSSNSAERSLRGGIPSMGQGGGGGGNRGVQPRSIFQTVNQTLLGYGIPTMNVGSIAVEPIVSVGLVLALIFFGIPGLLFGLVLFAVSQWSSNNQPPEFVRNIFGMQGSSRSGGGSGGSGGGGVSGGSSGNGYRLGRD